MAARKTRNELTISEKVDLFKELDNGVSQRVLAEKFNISRK
jgi:hypothetical protein